MELDTLKAQEKQQPRNICLCRKSILNPDDEEQDSQIRTIKAVENLKESLSCRDRAKLAFRTPLPSALRQEYSCTPDFLSDLTLVRQVLYHAY